MKPERDPARLLPPASQARGPRLVPLPASPDIIAEFQSDAVELEERVPPRIARMTLYGVTALMAAAVLWSSVSFIDEVVVARGKLITTKPTMVVQPLETSIIRAVNVSVGDVVRAGQPLVVLDATFSQADLDSARAKLEALDAEVQRLAAELAGADYATLAGVGPDAQLQARLFTQRRSFFAAQLDDYDQQIAGQASEIAAGHDQEAILVARRQTLVQIEDARQTLYQHETGSLLNLLSSRDARLDVDASLVELRGKAIEAGHALAKLKADRQAFVEDFKRATLEQLVQARGKRDAAAEDLKKLELRRSRVVLSAPADAVVLDLAARSIGSVVREAEPVMTLVPLDVPLQAEVSVEARDIGHVAAGDAVRVKLDAYPYQTFGTASGRIQTISRDAFPNERKDVADGPATPAVFHARVDLADEGRLGARASPPASAPVRLLPGMAVTAEIKVGRRRVISYFLYPLLRGLDTSIREP